MVNNCMKEYYHIACRQHPTTIPSLDGSLAGVPAGASPRKIGFFTSTSRDQKTEAKTPFLIAWLIARKKRTNSRLSPVDSARSAFLIAPISSNFSPDSFQPVLASIFIRRHGLTRLGRRNLKRSALRVFAHFAGGVDKGMDGPIRFFDSTVRGEAGCVSCRSGSLRNV